MEKHVEAVVEKSSSRTLKHAFYSNIFIVSREGEVREAKPVKQTRVKPHYKRGNARKVLVEPPGDEDKVLVEAKFIKNIKGRVKGELIVYDSTGTPVLKVVYRRLKVRRSWGDKNYAWAIEKLMDYLKLPVKRYNYDTGTTSAPRT